MTKFQWDGLMEVLTQIRDELRKITHEEPEQTPTVCPHPDEARVKLGGMGNSQEFHCRACGVTILGTAQL